MEIRGQAALVTGAGSGIGADVARHLAKAGAKVAVLDINKDAAEAVAKEIGGVGIGCDISDGRRRRGGGGRGAGRPWRRRASWSMWPAS